MTYGNALSLSQQWDTAYRLTSQTVSGVLDLDYPLYDANGNLKTRTDGFSSTSSFTYDALNRLDTGSGVFGSRDYDYDLNGNRTGLLSDAVTTVYSYTAGSNRIATETGWTYTLDANGNIIQRLDTDGAGWLLGYTTHNRLASVTERVVIPGHGNKPPSLDDVTIASYAYNGLGQRVSKTLADGTMTRFLYGTDGSMLAELDGSGVVQREYVNLNGQLLAVLDQASSQSGGSEIIIDNGTPPTGWSIKTSNEDYGTDYLYSIGGSGNGVRWTPVLASGIYDVYVWYVDQQQYSNSVPYTIQHNGQADIVTVDQSGGGGSWQLLADNLAFDGSGSEYVEVSDSTGKTTADAVKFVAVGGGGGSATTTVSYVHNDHLGTPQVMTAGNSGVVWRATYDPYGLATVSVNTVELNVRFPGQYYDSETGLHYNYFRYYDPETDRYLTSDPIGLAGGINPYLYANANPVKNIDPQGLLFLNATGAFVGALSGAAGSYYGNGGEFSFDVIRSAVIGAGLGFIAPQNAFGSAASALAANLIGQRLSDSECIDIPQAVGSAIGGGIASKAAPAITQILGNTHPTLGSGLISGFITGTGTFIGRNVGDGPCGCQ